MSRLFFFLIVVLAISCHQSTKEEDSIFIILGQNIDQETAHITQDNEMVYSAYKYQLEDPAVKDKVSVWFPAVNKMHELSDSIIAEIKTIKSTISIKNEGVFRNKQLSSHLQNLYDSLILYQRSVLNIDPEIKKNLKRFHLFLSPRKNLIQQILGLSNRLLLQLSHTPLITVYFLFLKIG